MNSEPLRKTFADEGEFVAGAASAVRAWRELPRESLLIGLQGPLGSGKTTWARGMLGGLGYTGRVPSPTYTLVEQYPLEDLTVIHADLYRLDADGDRELDALGIREWLAREATWLVVEWPAAAFERFDLHADTYTVLLTHDPKIDDPALHRSARRQPATLSHFSKTKAT